MSIDRSTHPNVVEYAVQTMIKRGKSPSAAAKDTSKKHHGTENMFFGPGSTAIDATKLENALWDRLVDFTIVGMSRIKEGKEHFALDGTLQHFNQKPSIRAELKRRVIEKMGRDPFANDDAPSLKENTMSTREDAPDAKAAGEKYATEQVNDAYFMDWVRDQLLEASRMPPEEVLPLETKSDALVIAKNMLQQLEWDTKRDLDDRELTRLIGDESTRENTREFYKGFRSSLDGARDWLADELLQINEGLRGGSAVGEAPARRRNEIGRPLIDDKLYSVTWRDGRAGPMSANDVVTLVRDLRRSWREAGRSGILEIQVWYRDGSLDLERRVSRPDVEETAQGSLAASDVNFQNGERIRIRIIGPKGQLADPPFWYTVTGTMSVEDVALQFTQTIQPGMFVSISDGKNSWTFQKETHGGQNAVRRTHRLPTARFRESKVRSPVDVLATLQPGDMVTVESRELPRPRKLVVTSLSQNGVYVSSGPVRPGHRSGGRLHVRDGEVWYERTMQQQTVRVSRLTRTAAAMAESRLGPDPVEDPFYIIQGLYNGPDAYSAGASFGYDEEDVAIAEAKKLARSPYFEGDYVRIITRDGELVWDSLYW